MNEHFYKTYEKVKTRILLRLLLPILLAGSLPIALHATHIVGGEIGYKCLGSNQYEITLKVYRDCFNGLEDFDRPAFIGIYDPAGNLVRRLDIPFSGVRDTLNPALNDPCLVVPGNVCVDTTTYRAVVSLSPNPIGGFYQISYVRCCRNKIIKNILEPEEVGAVYDIFLTTEAMQRCNSSPTFNKLPPNYICADKPFIFDHSATDPDGDSLVYKICTPFSGGSVTFPKPVPPRNPPPFDELEWAPGFGLDNLFGSGEPLRIDPVTGLLTARPLLQGTFVVGVCVEEYDRATGRLLSTTRRDFQYDIGICGDIRSAFFAPEVGCDLTVAFNNTSENSNQFRWFFDYPRTNLTSTERSPTFTFPAVGTYTVALIAQPGSNCVDTFLQQITIVDNTIDIQLSVGVVDCDTTSLLNLQDLSVDTASAIIAWNWTVTYGDLVTQTSNEQNPRFSVPIGAVGNVSLTVTSANNCTKTIAVPFETGNDPIPVDVIPSQIAACQGDSVPINPNAPINSGVVYSWSPADLLDDPTSPNPIFIATETTVFTVTLGPADGSCVTTKVVTVNVGPLPSLIVTDTICALDLQSYAIRFLSDGDRITATPGTLVNNGDGSYTVSNIPNGQFVEIFAGYAGNSCNVRVAIGPYSCQCPELPPPVSDGDKTVCENEPLPLLTVTVGTGQTADWFDAPTGGILLLSGSLSYQPTQAGTYYAGAREISTGCTSSTRTPVTLLVNPAPVASISLSSSIICSGEMVQITAIATGGTPDYSFVWNDGTVAPIRVVSPLETTVYVVTVTDENNCRSEASATITVNQPPAIDLESDAPNNTICIGQSATLTTNVSGGVEPYIVLWD
ncbi:MAG TPA: hypothetical protein PKE68_06405, partial [Saprospiraceae bacterium]|nr:hypothetical protein [Saprospiraceae bacterium]